MSDDFEELEKVFDLPDQFEEVKKRIDKLEATVRNNGIDDIRLNVFQAASKAAEIHFTPLSLSASIMDRAKLTFEQAALQTLVRRRRLLALGIVTALLLAAVAGLMLGGSPRITVAAIKTEAGCGLFGGHWVAAQKMYACAFEVPRQR
jgi:hypothetical protein